MTDWWYLVIFPRKYALRFYRNCLLMECLKFFWLLLNFCRQWVRCQKEHGQHISTLAMVQTQILWNSTSPRTQLHMASILKTLNQELAATQGLVTCPTFDQLCIITTDWMSRTIQSLRKCIFVWKFVFLKHISELFCPCCLNSPFLNQCEGLMLWGRFICVMAFLGSWRDF